MASTVNSVSTGNNASGNASSQIPTGRASLRPSASTRVPDNRRPSPVDGGPRRSNSQKAWTQGTNPITQRYSQQNGNMTHQKQSASAKASKESNTSDNHAHDRLIFLVTSFIGLNAVVTTKNGEKFTGIFSSSTLEASEASFVLKMVQRSKPDQSRINGVSDVAVPFLGSAPEHSMVFDAKDVLDVSVADVSPADVTTKTSNVGASAGFRTDTDISGNLAIRERTLKRWEPAADDLEAPLETSTNTAGWDQFEANERLFGATSNYDETYYTTTIDRSDPTYKRREAEAARIAREIEGADTDNPHVMEERGLTPAQGAGEDEEEKYSGVRRDEKNFPPLVSGQPNKYTPPARRQAAAAAGAPSSSTKQPAAPVPTQAREQVPPKPQPGPSTAAAAKATTNAQQKSVPDRAAATTTTATVPKRAADNATANVEAEVLDHFRQFANNEKLKMQERRRNQVSYDRNVKLNELMKFSKNFKLATPVPRDLVPILAKDPNKQEQIISRAQVQSEEEEKTPSDSATPVSADQKPAPPRGPAPARNESEVVPPQAQSERVNYNRGRQIYPPTGPNAGPSGRFQNQAPQPGRPGTGMLSHRLADNLQQRKGAAMGPAPAPLSIQDARLPPSGPAGERSGVSSPNKTPASTKFNVRAMEFKPNPAASSFTPGAAASPQPAFRGRSVSRAASPSVFFGSKKPRPVTERPSLNDQFNPIKRMRKETTEQADKLSFNGGISPAYRTMPTWDVPAGNNEKTYLQMFKAPAAVPGMFPQARAGSNSQLPHQPQMPFPFQQAAPGMPPVSGPPHGPHLHPQQHHSVPHFDDPHRMQVPSSTSQMFPSPRLQPNHVVYPSPMAPHAQLAFQQPVPQFYMNQGAPPPPHMRHYPGAPQFMNPQGAMAAPMMVQQPSGGPYMGVPQGMAPYTPQMQMYSPNPGHAYPQHAPPPQPHSGFPSPGRGAPMMMHQNSQSGQPPQPAMFMTPGQPGQPMYPAQQAGHMPPVRGNYQQQPHFQSSPRQAHHYPPHQHRTPSSGYNQVPQMAPQVPPSQPPPAGAPPPEAAENEVK